ncbi:hypothetical protein AAMO2058_001090100 [Amorphochlora amoebiformis]
MLGGPRTTNLQHASSDITAYGHQGGMKPEDEENTKVSRAHTQPMVGRERQYRRPRRRAPFQSPDGKWRGEIRNDFALGHPILKHFIRPPGRLEGHHGEDWHHKLNRFLHHHRTHLVIIAIELEFAFKNSEIQDLEHACEEVEAMHAGASCPSHPGDKSLEDGVRGVEYASVGILCIFAIDNLLLLLANGKEFFRNPLYLLDAVVVYLAIIFETVLSGDGGLAGGIIIIVRAWRFVRIGHGIYETTHDSPQKQDEKSRDITLKRASIGSAPDQKTSPDVENAVKT